MSGPRRGTREWHDRMVYLIRDGKPYPVNLKKHLTEYGRLYECYQIRPRIRHEVLYLRDDGRRYTVGMADDQREAESMILDEILGDYLRDEACPEYFDTLEDAQEYLDDVGEEVG